MTPLVYMTLNHHKSASGVTLAKLLGHIVSKRGIKVHPSEINNMPLTKTDKETRGFLGRL